jgi:hypothetical protein
MLGTIPRFNTGVCGREVVATANLDGSYARRRERSAGRDEETGFQIEQRNRRRKKDAPPSLNFLTKKAPYKGLSADSEEKHEPASDIDIAAVDSPKVLILRATGAVFV